MPVDNEVKKKKRRVRAFVSDAFQPGDWEEMPMSIRTELEMYGFLLRGHPMMDYCDVLRDALTQHVERRVTAYVSLGPKCLQLEPVTFLVDKAYWHKNVMLPVTTSFSGAVQQAVAAGLAHMLTSLFGMLELGVRHFSDTTLLKYGLNESQAETFRGLASGYAGTFDELLETAKKL